MENSEVCRPSEQEFLFQWGTRKRMRCAKVQLKSGLDVKIRRTAFRVVRADSEEAAQAPKTPPSKPDFMQTSRAVNETSNSPPAAVKSMAAEGVKVAAQNNRRHSSPEKSDKIHTRAFYNNNNGCSSTQDTGKIYTGGDSVQQKRSSNLEAFVWPKFEIALTSKEKEEDFMAIKGSKLPTRPKKRAKFLQNNLLLVSPGSWLCELSQERYEVREKETNKKRPRGLKAMHKTESDSD